MKNPKYQDLKGLLTEKEIEELNNGTFFPLPEDTGYFNAFEMMTRIRNLETAGKMPSLEAVLKAVKEVPREQKSAKQKESKRRKDGKA